ncbi:MAG: response regulator [Chloroflexi bacterium]|nr:response regulator [Ktedonobacteraceae bacterium]MBV9019802.1 response regulator [Ktedonobacteraceae bacterium]MBV9705982.1 response regulator [Chloroflexota bacterium]
MGKRILVIEPSRTIRAILSIYLQQVGHQVMLFKDYEAATQALIRFQTEPPNMAFVALHTNRLESTRIVGLLRRLYAQTTIVIMTAQEDSKQYAVQHLMQVTQAIPLLKPFWIQEVLALVAASEQNAPVHMTSEIRGLRPK